MASKVVIDKYRGSVEYEMVKAELITAAKYRGMITYQDVAAIMGLPSSGSHMGSATGHLLGEISEDEVLAGRPMLSALSVSVSGKPGSGFAGLCVDLGLIEEGQDWEPCWRQQREMLYKTWAPRR